MGDDRPDIETGLEETGQPVPGSKQPPAGNPVHTNPLEDHFVREIKRHRAGGNTEQRDPPTVLHCPKGLVQGLWVSRHLQRRINPFTSGDIQNRCRQLFRGIRFCVEDVIRTNLLGQTKPVVTDI